MLADYHVHTPYCGHAQGKVVQYVDSAIIAGIQEIGFADHLGRYYLSKSQKRRYWDWGMDEKILDVTMPNCPICGKFTVNIYP